MAPVWTDADVGEMATDTAAAVVIVTFAEADLVESAALLAVTVTLFGLGTLLGAT